MMEIDGIVIEPVGQSEPVCPTCGTILDCFPLRKISCPACSSAIYSRVQPYDGKKRLTSEHQARAVEKQWEVYQEFKGMLRLAHDSPAILAMFEDMHTGRRGQAEIDMDVVAEYFSRIPGARTPVASKPALPEPLSAYSPIAGAAERPARKAIGPVGALVRWLLRRI